MFVATVRFSSLDAKSAAALIRTLTDIRKQAGGVVMKGFVQTLLLRGAKGSAMLVTAWENRSSMMAFAASERGRRAAAQLQSVVGNTKIEYAEYRATWQGVRLGEQQ